MEVAGEFDAVGPLVADLAGRHRGERLERILERGEAPWSDSAPDVAELEVRVRLRTLDARQEKAAFGVEDADDRLVGFLAVGAPEARRLAGREFVGIEERAVPLRRVALSGQEKATAVAASSQERATAKSGAVTKSPGSA